MGGTFDPIHQGHLVTAEAARHKYALDKVIFVPSGKPPHKKGYDIMSAEQRYLMTVLATATNPFFEVSRIEVDRSGESYTIDTVKSFKKMYGQNTELFFITGADAILEILTWKNFEELLHLSYFIAATRPGFNLLNLRENLKKLSPTAIERITPIEVPAMAISSTEIRRRIRKGESIKYLLPEAVERFIFKNKLYF